MIERVTIWGLPLARLTLKETVETVASLVAARRSAYFITANVHYAMLTERHHDLRAINEGAAFVLADGKPLVWASRLTKTPLPERVAGSDLIFELARAGAERGHRFFLLGAAPGVGAAAAARLCQLNPGLQIVGVESPDLTNASRVEEAALAARIREANTDILYVALGQPKGERFIVRNLDAFGLAVCVQVGASLDFVADRVRRAPVWMQRSGLEWVYRLLQEPRRLFGRYAANLIFAGRMFTRDLARLLTFRRARAVESAESSTRHQSESQEVYTA